MMDGRGKCLLGLENQRLVCYEYTVTLYLKVNLEVGNGRLGERKCACGVEMRLVL